MREGLRHLSQGGGQRTAFTLVELMVVIAIVGVLAALGGIGYKKYMDAAKSSEAVDIIASIKGSQEAYKTDTLQYLDVSGMKTNCVYPDRTTPRNLKVQWGGTAASGECANAAQTVSRWRILNVAGAGAVYFRYSTVAGAAGLDIKPTAGLPTSMSSGFGLSVEPWYIVQAEADLNADGTNSYCVSHSNTNDVFWENQGD